MELTESNIDVVPVVSPGVVQPILTDEQAFLVHQALIAYLNSPEGQLSEFPAEEQIIKSKVSDLTYFFSNVVEHPELFQLKSKDDNKRILRAAKAVVKGPAQPPRKNKRKRNQERRAGFAKRTRADKRYEAEQQRAARKIMEDEELEAKEAYQRASEQNLARLDSLAARDTFTFDQMTELLEGFGAQEGAEYLRSKHEENDPQARIDAAAAHAAKEAEPLD